MAPTLDTSVINGEPLATLNMGEAVRCLSELRPDEAVALDTVQEARLSILAALLEDFPNIQEEEGQFHYELGDATVHSDHEEQVVGKGAATLGPYSAAPTPLVSTISPSASSPPCSSVSPYIPDSSSMIELPPFGTHLWCL